MFQKTIPATVGPTKTGIDSSPWKNPNPCDAPAGPQMSKAKIHFKLQSEVFFNPKLTYRSPYKETKHPSNIPKVKVAVIIVSKGNAKNGAALRSIIHKPMNTRATCTNTIRLTFGRSHYSFFLFYNL